MGQRMQFVVKIHNPRYTDKLANISKYNIVSYHNQWSYGVGAINRAYKISNYFELVVKEIRNWNLRVRNKEELCLERENFEEITKRIFERVTLSSGLLHPENNVLDYQHENRTPDYIKSIGDFRAKTLDEFMGICDNNNGWVFFDFTNEAPRIAFHSGNEDRKPPTWETPRSYLNLFKRDLLRFDTEEEKQEIEKMLTYLTERNTLAGDEVEKWFEEAKTDCGNSKLKKETSK